MGVYYFDYRLDDFGKALTKFKAHHPELIVTAISGSGPIGGGYWVNMEKRNL